MQEDSAKLYKQAFAKSDPLVFLAADLRAQVQAHAVHRFLVTPYDKQETEQQGLLLWIMTPDMRITSTHTIEPQRAMKVLFRHASLAQIEEEGKTQQEIECVAAPLPGVFDLLSETLARHFEQAGRQVTDTWRASYLIRHG